MIRKLTSVVILVLLAGGLWLWGRGDNPASAPPATQRTVVDGAGRSVSLPVHPQRVIALNASNIDLYVSAGGSLVGRATTETLPPAVRSVVQSVPKVGLPPNPNLEQIIALKPDLVIGANIPYHHVLLPVLEKAGIPVLLQSLDRYQQILDTLRFYGELTGQPAKAAAEIERIEKRYAAAVARAASREKPNVLILWGTTESFSMALSSSFSGDLLKRLGGKNIADQAQDTVAGTAYVPLSMEFVARTNPEIILFITHSSDEAVEAKFRKELAEHPVWRNIRAVKENRVHKLPYHLFAVNPGTQVGEALEVLDKLLYPETN